MKTMSVTAVIVSAAVGALAVGSSAQSARGDGVTRPAFDVASIKPHRPGDSAVMSVSPILDRFIATNIPLRVLVQWAYRRENNKVFRDNQIIGGPRWLDTDHFDVEAKAEGGAHQIPLDQMVLMAQSMLEERFQMRTHRETREMPVYALVLGKTGSRMKLSADQTPEPTGQRRIFNPGGPQPRGTLMPSRSGDSNIALTGSAIPIATLANSLEGYVDRPVVDQTNLKGLFDLRLEFSRPVPASPNVAASTERPDRPAPADPSGTVIFTAIQEQLGLKLEPVKAPVEVLIIDRAEHPSPD